MAENKKVEIVQNIFFGLTIPSPIIALIIDAWILRVDFSRTYVGFLCAVIISAFCIFFGVVGIRFGKKSLAKANIIAGLILFLLNMIFLLLSIISSSGQIRGIQFVQETCDMINLNIIPNEKDQSVLATYEENIQISSASCTFPKTISNTETIEKTICNGYWQEGFLDDQMNYILEQGYSFNPDYPVYSCRFDQDGQYTSNPTANETCYFMSITDLGSFYLVQAFKIAPDESE